MSTRRGVKRSAPDLGALPKVNNYDPVLFIRCHNQRENDRDTKIWKCSFEPDLDDPTKTTNLLASCGGKTICILDVVAEIVIKRFKDKDKNENFYTLAWSTIETSSKTKVNILAVAGEGATVKLINPTDCSMYAIIRGHKKYISCLSFHPIFTRFLFSGSKDGFVFLWDIGIPDKTDGSNFSPLLKISLQDTVGDALNLVFSAQSDLLVAGAERGCVGWVINDFNSLSAARRAKVIEKVDYTFVHPKSKFTTVDGLLCLPDDMLATKQVGSGEILIWSLHKHLKGKRGQQEVVIQPLLKLKYPLHNIPYLNLGFSNGLLGVGDHHGNVLLYNLESVLKSKKSKNSSDDESEEEDDSVWQASCILEWPNVYSSETGNDEPTSSELVVNTVALSSCHEYVTGGTDNNLVCVWKNVAQQSSPSK